MEWRVLGADWRVRHRLEVRLLAELRRGGVPAWRLAVITLRPRGTMELIRDLGLDKRFGFVHTD
jgi:phosphoglycolate phosphatase-like HAD superfamily hydrolase